MKRATATRARDESPLLVRLAWPIAALFTVAVPLWVSIAGREAFRLPKLVLFHTEGILLAALLIVAALLGRFDSNRRWNLRDPYLTLPLLVLLWTAIVTVLSPDRRVSSDSLMTVVAGVAIYLVAWERGRSRSLDVAWVVIAPALVNAVAVFVEVRHAWDVRFARAIFGDFSEASLMRVTPFGFMGNRDDLGTLLVPAAILAIASALAAVNRRGRLLFGISATILVVAIFTTKTLTAIAALAAAIFILGFIHSWKSGAAGVLLLLVALPSAFFLHPGLRARGGDVWRNLQEGRFDQLLVGRVAPNLAAVGMVRDHPILGVGPGLFGRNYYEYRVEAAQAHPALVPTSGWIDYFVDAHNDHLQIAAETGVIGYLLFAGALALGFAISFRRTPGDAKDERFMRARLVAAPLFTALFVLALLQFPMRLAGTLQLLTVCAGLTVGWSRNARD
ncbi:MAG: O-antigen ligase family protein [Thermoanaerobaculia bacterium]